MIGLRRRGVILLYHRVARLDADPWRLAVDPARFDDHMSLLRRRYRPMRLADLVRARDVGTLPRRAVAVTFDDGYAELAGDVVRSLDHHDVPATAFLTSAYLEGTREFWWDELERLLLTPVELPRELSLDIDGARCERSLGAAAEYDAAARARDHGWRAWIDPPPTERHAAYLALYARLKPAAERARRAALEALRAWARLPDAPRPTHRPLAAEQTCTLAATRLVDVGAHTVTHPRLAALPAIEQREEMDGSRDAIEQIVGREVRGLAYPYGQRGDYGADTVALARDAGFDYACANVVAPVERRARPFELPRLQVDDCDAGELDRRIAWCLAGKAAA